MQISPSELLVVLIIILVLYGLSRAKPPFPNDTSAYREKRQPEDETAGGERYGQPRSEAAPPRAMKEEDPYTILNVSRNATQAEITAAYRKLAQMYHPDKVAGLAPEYSEIAERKMKDINAAYERLMSERRTRG